MSSNPSNKDLKSEILIDIGCQKTGTTSRQINLYSKLSQDTLLYTGKFYERKSDSNTRLQNFVSSACKDPCQFVALIWSNFIVSYFNESNSKLRSRNCRALLFSEEKLLLNIWQMGFGSKSNWKNATVPLSLFVSALNHFQIGIFCTIRDPIEYIRSIYIQTMFTRWTFFDATVISLEEFISLALAQYEINSLSSPLFPVFRKDFIKTISAIACQTDLSSYLYMDFPSGSIFHGNPSNALALLSASVRDFYRKPQVNAVHNESRKHPLKSDIIKFAIESSTLTFSEDLSIDQKIDLVTVNNLQRLDILTDIMDQSLSPIT